MIKTITMKSSPYSKNFSNELEIWEDTLEYIQSLFDKWIDV